MSQKPPIDDKEKCRGNCEGARWCWPGAFPYWILNLQSHVFPTRVRRATRGLRQGKQGSADLFLRSAVLRPITTKSRGPTEQVRATHSQFATSCRLCQPPVHVTCAAIAARRARETRRECRDTQARAEPARMSREGMSAPRSSAVKPAFTLMLSTCIHEVFPSAEAERKLCDCAARKTKAHGQRLR